jgi:TupA-like ATPgrasp
VRKLLKRILPDPMVEIMGAIVWHKRRHGAFPRLRDPQTFSEKIAHRKIFDRRPLLTQCADKYAVRKFVASRLGPDVLTKLYCATKNPSEIPFAELPDKFVIKPTHGSGWVRIVTDKSQMDIAEIVRACEAWLSESFYERGSEWAYKNVEPRILVEEYIEDGSGDKAPIDYKMFVFDGKVALIQADVARFSTHRRGFYDKDWNEIDVRLRHPPVISPVPRPKRLAEMIQAAEKLCRDIDFIRADFYETEHKIYFGELTATPGSGLERFDPVAFDAYLGSLWKLPAKARLRGR